MNSSPSAPPLAVKSGALRIILACLVSLLVGLFVGHAITYHWAAQHYERGFTTPYQAVLLSNGSVYYGKLEGYNTRHPVLTSVFYILSKTDSETKQVTNVLVKRGKELHGPDRMYLNPSQIIFVEPVGTGSKVAQLIDEASH